MAGSTTKRRRRGGEDGRGGGEVGEVESDGETSVTKIDVADLQRGEDMNFADASVLRLSHGSNSLHSRIRESTFENLNGLALLSETFVEGQRTRRLLSAVAVVITGNGVSWGSRGWIYGTTTTTRTNRE
uniref:Uncharacterized protein n=1 Tax=Vespula pensylvanica TaxID=30213 RepID=A0A834U3W6_VESPE|nr:hypothetical protein H0235_011970 [Vespula pensylvanica]